MRLRLLLPTLLLACALVAPATAHAHGGPVAPAAARHAHYAQAAAATADPTIDPLIAHFLELARVHWNASPNCPDGISLQRAEWLPDPGVWAAAVQGGCAIAFDPDFYPAPADYDNAWWQAAMCSVVAHEWGHLLGYGHVSDPNNLMNPVTPINIVGGCPTWGLPGAEPAQTTPATSSTTRKASKKTKKTKKTKAAKRSTCAAKARSTRGRAKSSRRSCSAPAKRRAHP
jgi:Matrixin